MSTNSCIAIENTDGSIEAAYCHWDGYLTGVGKDLLANYKDEGRVRGLINAGNMSVPGDHYANWEGRGGIEDNKPNQFRNVVEWLNAGDYYFCPYMYLFNVSSGIWLVSNCDDGQLNGNGRSGDKLVDLEAALLSEGE